MQKYDYQNHYAYQKKQIQNSTWFIIVFKVQ